MLYLHKMIKYNVQKLPNRLLSTFMVIGRYCTLSFDNEYDTKESETIMEAFHSAINRSNSTIRKDGREHDASKSDRSLIRCHYSRHSFAASMSRLR